MGWQELMSDVKQEVREVVKEQAVKSQVSRLEQVEEGTWCFLRQDAREEWR